MAVREYDGRQDRFMLASCLQDDRIREGVAV
jgi:hypothetical protein